MRGGVLFLFFVVHGYGQVAFYGLRGGGTYYHYRTKTANVRPSVGWEIGAGAKFALKQNAPWKIMSEFGYFMGNTKTVFDTSQYLSVLSGRYVAAPTKVTIWTHYLNFQILVRYHFEKEDRFAFYSGGQGLYLLGQTLIAQYVQDSTLFQEWVNNPIDNVLTVLPRLTWNLVWGVSFRMLPQSRHYWYLYVQMLHQLQAYLYPTGVVVGIRFYQGREK